MKLVGFDLYWTCISSPQKVKWFSIPKDIWRLLLTKPASFEQLQSWNLEIDWVKIELEKQILEKIKTDIENILIYPDFLEIIKYLKSNWYNTAVVSNLAQVYEQPLEKLREMQAFDYEVLSFDVWLAKPDPEIRQYLKNITWIN